MLCLRKGWLRTWVHEHEPIACVRGSNGGNKEWHLEGYMLAQSLPHVVTLLSPRHNPTEALSVSKQDAWSGWEPREQGYFKVHENSVQKCKYLYSLK